ncbi:hypothetical protein L5515_005447 [Caenorhabditis briggsae]|uniref:Uncharacterized protein n=1 Tax=Caenorhabditis briggsae TaxID=6238 RepID=A0AAE9EKD4_CAEBR|nr:hypothetical protein L5515_005447 [Caenorhabditis briggsae]
MAGHDDMSIIMSAVGQQLQEGTPYYELLLKMIEEIGKDIRPTYTFNKSTNEKLKKHIHCAKMLIKACQTEAENDKKKADAAAEAARIQAALRKTDGPEVDEEAKKSESKA